MENTDRKGIKDIIRELLSKNESQESEMEHRGSSRHSRRRSKRDTVKLDQKIIALFEGDTYGTESSTGGERDMRRYSLKQVPESKRVEDTNDKKRTSYKHEERFIEEREQAGTLRTSKTLEERLAATEEREKLKPIVKLHEEEDSVRLKSSSGVRWSPKLYEEQELPPPRRPRSSSLRTAEEERDRLRSSRAFEEYFEDKERRRTSKKYEDRVEDKEKRWSYQQREDNRPFDKLSWCLEVQKRELDVRTKEVEIVMKEEREKLDKEKTTLQDNHRKLTEEKARMQEEVTAVVLL